MNDIYKYAFHKSQLCQFCIVYQNVFIFPKHISRLLSMGVQASKTMSPRFVSGYHCNISGNMKLFTSAFFQTIFRCKPLVTTHASIYLSKA